MEHKFKTISDSIINNVVLPPPSHIGSLVRVVGLTFEAKGINAPLGAICEIKNENTMKVVQAEVVGFQNDTLYLMPFSEATGIGPGSSVEIISNDAQAEVGNNLLGRIIDARGAPLDEKEPLQCENSVSLKGTAINPMDRDSIKDVLDVGVKAINSFLTIGKGQRIGLIAGSGVGKSSLMGMITRFTEADIVVIGLIGERGREVQEFIKESLGKEGLKKSVVIAAPANISPVLRMRATFLTHSIAEYFRDQGKNVLMMLDSLTRVAHAQREIGLAIGEPPTAKGYPPSVFSLLPNLIERAGVGKQGRGAITAIYTVLAENDDNSDPIVDIARASLDGQVLLSRSLADAAHYPAIDLNGSISRVMQSLVDQKTNYLGSRFRRLWSLYQQNEDLIKVGAYKSGTNAELDEAIRARDKMISFLRQDLNQRHSFQDSIKDMSKIMNESESLLKSPMS